MRRAYSGTGRVGYYCVQVRHRQLSAPQGHCSTDLPDSRGFLPGIFDDQYPVQRGYAQSLVYTLGTNPPPAAANLALHLLPTGLSTGPIWI